MSAQLSRQFQHHVNMPSNHPANKGAGTGVQQSRQAHPYPYPYPHTQDPNATVSVCPEISDIWDKPVVVLKPW